MNSSLVELIHNIRVPLHIIKCIETQHMHLITDAQHQSFDYTKTKYQYCGFLPALYPEWLGSSEFVSTHRLRFPYVVGEMANNIATAKMVIHAANAAMFGFFGAAGLMPAEIEKNIAVIQHALQGVRCGWGSNLIHSPHEPHLEEAVVDLYLKYGVTRVSASAYMKVNPAIVRYACHGLSLDPQGNIVRKNHVIAKISRKEVAMQFMMPASQEILTLLLQQNKLTHEEAALARNIPLAGDITVEADSGGHTDNRPLLVLFPIIQTLAHSLTKQYQYPEPIRIGAAGGIGTPEAVAAAFALGADYVLTGSINQAAVESGLSDEGRRLLLNADMCDMMMAPAADMFEQGVRLQVLKRGTLFGLRANKLYDLYMRYPSLDAIPEDEKNGLEEHIFKAPLPAVWDKTCEFFLARDPMQLSKAEENEKHKMALVFRSYLGWSSQWAIQGDVLRQADYQIWCGPAMGAFNNWVRGTFLEALENRTIEQIGRNLLEGAAVVSRVQQLRSFGFRMPANAERYVPRRLS